MKKRFSAAEAGKAIVKVSTELGRDNITISVGTNKLDWNEITLSAEDSKAFKQFMRENDV